MSAQADAEEAQLKSNRVFAGVSNFSRKRLVSDHSYSFPQNMATEVSNDAKELDVMEDEEQKARTVCPLMGSDVPFGVHVLSVDTDHR